MLFFDLDDTLVDHHNAAKKAVLGLVENIESNISLTKTEVLNLWQELIDKYFPLFVEGKLTYTEQGRERVKELFLNHGITLNNDKATQKFAEYGVMYHAFCDVYDDVIPALEKLKENNAMAIITNGPQSGQREKLVKSGILSYFQDVVTPDEDKIGKPSSEIFLWACKNNDCSPEDSIYVGDNWLHDVEPSHKLGFKAVWIKRRPEQKIPEDGVVQPDQVLQISSLTELLEHIEK